MAHAPSATGSASSSSLAVQRLIAAAPGAFIIGPIGVLHMSVAHNASHDCRHSMACPFH